MTDSTSETVTLPSTVHRPVLRLLGWVVAASAIWLSWPFLQPHLPTGIMAKVTAPFYAARLSMADAPVALPVPVAGVSFRQIANTYGAPRGSTRKHEGLDIFAKRGTPVLSATEGMVTRVGTNRLGGNVVWVLGPGGQRHYYAHLDTQADLSAGDRVAVGTELGTVGDTGNARGTPPHLHYGVYATGGAINPYPLLKEGAR